MELIPEPSRSGGCWESRRTARTWGSQLIPLISFIGLGMGSAALYLLRLALYSPDVSWDRKNNPEPWNKLGPTDQYKTGPHQ
ncbi:NADH dehydrogenase [ubiquinone] 1 alpha subcomplex subunit 4-like 2 [Alligator sinensis]|uniref:NADH dehydrogenase [ubiquinone] 1 alpha subcomplex subunit 4-like 2 n=1 Tax=Alligator sinensis TaxID=38654 RepID=A0A3Q0FMD1_ALLSI|nr:NADH dehydrogenase [ubiquinone] 1 alpha subcomplex subunit 4-like 2 [Alligator sinensis]